MSPDASKKPPSKTEILNTIAEKTQLTKQQVAAVLDTLHEEIGRCLHAVGSFAIPGLVKIEKKDVAAKPARLGAPDPFRPGQTRDFPAKPASTKISVRALKQLKDLVK